MKILELWLILAISSVAYCSIPFDYNILENNVAPFQVRAINFVPIPSYNPVSGNSLLKEFLPPRIPASEYGPPTNSDMLFKPPTKSETTELPASEEVAEEKKMSFMTTEQPKMVMAMVYLPPGLPELPPAPEIPSTTTTEKPFDKEAEEEISKPEEEYGPPKSNNEMLFKTSPEPEMTTAKVYLPPGLPELPPAPEIPSTTTTEKPFDKEAEEEISKPEEEYGPPKSDNEMLFKTSPEPEMTTAKVYLPPGLPELPPAPEIPSTTTTESSYVKEATTTEEISSPRVPDVSDESFTKIPETTSVPISELPKPSQKPIEVKEEEESDKPMNEYSLSKDGHHFNFKISVTANSNTYPSLPYYFVPGVQAPSHPQIILPPGSSASMQSNMPEIKTEVEFAPYTEAEIIKMSEMSEAPYPATSMIPEIPIVKTEMMSAPYPPSILQKEMLEVSSSSMPLTTTPLPMIISQEIQHYIPPKSSFGAPYPAPLPYSKYGL